MLYMSLCMLFDVSHGMSVVQCMLYVAWYVLYAVGFMVYVS